jgi:hypothetical protein
VTITLDAQCNAECTMLNGYRWRISSARGAFEHWAFSLEH